jgi:hypothetical protein
MAENDFIHRKISELEFQALVKPIIGLPVSRAWRGGGSVFGLDVGKLFKCHLFDEEWTEVGRFGVLIEWSWRIESSRTIVCGSRSQEGTINKGIASLQGRTIQEINLTNRLPEISIRLSGNRWLQSLSTVEAQPRWVTFIRDDRGQARAWLTCAQGKAIIETKTANTKWLNKTMNLLET